MTDFKVKSVNEREKEKREDFMKNADDDDDDDKRERVIHKVSVVLKFRKRERERVCDTGIFLYYFLFPQISNKNQEFQLGDFFPLYHIQRILHR